MIDNSSSPQPHQRPSAWLGEALIAHLRRAVRKADAQRVKELLDTGANPNWVEEPGVASVLYHAAAKGNLEIVQLLLKAGANPNADENPPAPWVGSVMDRLGYGPNSPMLRAAIHGHEPICKLLAPLTEVEAREYAWRVYESRRRKVDDSTKRLLRAAKKGKIDVVKELLASGCNVNAQDRQGGTALFYAVKEQHAELVRFLLGVGALPEIATNTGDMPIIVSSAFDDTEILRALLAAGANPNARGEQLITPLMQAAAVGNTNAAELLIAAGAGIDVTDVHGRTALLWAAEEGQSAMAELLIRAGANVQHRDQEGRTALYRARNPNPFRRYVHRDESIAQILMRHGATE